MTARAAAADYRLSTRGAARYRTTFLKLFIVAREGYSSANFRKAYDSAEPKSESLLHYGQGEKITT